MQAGWVDSDGDGVRDREGVKLAFVLLGKDKAKLDAISAHVGGTGRAGGGPGSEPARPDRRLPGPAHL